MKFNKKNIPNLDEVVLKAVNLFIKSKLPKIKIGKYNRLLVVGSGNAAVTGKIIFEKQDAVFADESNYKEKLKNIKAINKAVLISASGGKHAPLIAKELKKRKINTILLTNTKDSLAEKYANKTYIFPKQAEPYTYNTSTYMGMILAYTKENPKNILNYLKKVKRRIPKNLKKYDSFYIIVPDEFDLIREMFLTKFDELFGSKISGRVFTPDQTKHAKTLVPSERELFISFGYENKLFGKNRFNVNLPKKSNYAMLLAVGYYVIGHIQKQNKPYFKDNLENYTKKASKMFKQKINPIAE